MTAKLNFIKTILFLAVLVTFISCQEGKEPQTAELKKDGSVEIVFETSHLGDSLDILKTIKRVYVKNEVVKEITETDTIPSLGKEMKEAENESGEVQKVEVPKEYELFVTIK